MALKVGDAAPDFEMMNQDKTPVKLEASLKCRSCRRGRYAPPVHMIKLTATRSITPYKWVHPTEER